MCDADQSQQYDSQPEDIGGFLGLPDERRNSLE